MDPLVVQGLKLTFWVYVFLIALAFWSVPILSWIKSMIPIRIKSMIVIRLRFMKRISFWVICAIFVIAIAYVYANRANLLEDLKTLNNNYAGVLTAFATFIAALVSAFIALWLGHYREKWRRPKLTLCFDPKGA